MKLTNDQIDQIIFALDREIDLERMSDEEIIEFAKKENGVDSTYIIELQEIKDLFQTYLDKKPCGATLMSTPNELTDQEQEIQNQIDDTPDSETAKRNWWELRDEAKDLFTTATNFYSLEKELTIINSLQYSSDTFSNFDCGQQALDDGVLDHSLKLLEVCAEFAAKHKTYLAAQSAADVAKQQYERLRDKELAHAN